MINRLRRYFVTGLLAILPIFLSVFILVFIFRIIDKIFGSFVNLLLKKYLGIVVPGLGLILFILIIPLVGFISVHFLGRKFTSFLDKTFSRFPLIKYIYPLFKQTVKMVLSHDSQAFKRVVLIEWPNKGAWTLGFVTNEGHQEINAKAKAELLNVFVPLVITPTTGFLIFVPRNEAVFLDLTVTQAMQLIISGGIINPDSLPRETKE